MMSGRKSKLRSQDIASRPVLPDDPMYNRLLYLRIIKTDRQTCSCDNLVFAVGGPDPFHLRNGNGDRRGRGWLPCSNRKRFEIRRPTPAQAVHPRMSGPRRNLCGRSVENSSSRDEAKQGRMPRDKICPHHGRRTQLYLQTPHQNIIRTTEILIGFAFRKARNLDRFQPS